MNYLHPSEIERLSHSSNHPFDEIRADSFTPSDYILLGDARWTVRRDQPQLSQMMRRPGTDALIRALATAFLVNEKAGNIRLHLAKSRYGHFNRFQYVESTFIRHHHHWPADSLEANFAASGKVLDLISALVDRESNLQAALADHVLLLMANRGLMRRETVRHRKFGVIRRNQEHYVIGPGVYAALASQAASTAAQLIPLSAETRPELTEELLRDTRAVLSS